MWICLKMRDVEPEWFYSRSATQLTIIQCCGTKTVYSGSGSDFEKVSVPDPDSDPDPNHILHSFSNKKFCTKSCCFKIRSRTFAQKVFISFFFNLENLYCFCENFCHSFFCRSQSGSGSGPECIPVTVPIRHKVAVPVPQHCNYPSLKITTYIKKI
jgi:hypothetical protein